MQLPRNRSKLGIRICSPVSSPGLWSVQETTASTKNIFIFAVLNKYAMDPIFLFFIVLYLGFFHAWISFPKSIKLCLSLPRQFPGGLEFVGIDKNAIESNQSYETLTRPTSPSLVLGFVLFCFFISFFCLTILKFSIICQCLQWSAKGQMFSHIFLFACPLPQYFSQISPQLTKK